MSMAIATREELSSDEQTDVAKTRAAGAARVFLLHKFPIESPQVEVGGGEFYSNTIPKRKCFFAALAHDAVIFFVEHIVISAERSQANESFRLGFLFFDIHAPFVDTGNYSFECLPNFSLHKFNLLVFNGLALGFGCFDLPFGGVHREALILLKLRIRNSGAAQVVAHDTVYQHIRVAADGGGEVRVVFE